MAEYSKVAAERYWNGAMQKILTKKKVYTIIVDTVSDKLACIV